ncbi:hypothetical protein ICM_05640 [Bacillus cereus BAG1X2-3]|nr:hypothetical protein ICC_05995 [Bacillus cereus BAG1X1-1]EOO42903.1 hypothetical protein ICI_06218 [Bacillus cereus BAG1X2-1]EOO56443.1 hypothetical protein ICM_05640 [Bacillus cereus BAG1X2-3]EOP00243.1 hypothetical protein ICO_06493 [Bacillus cereus BAG2O-1]
MANLYQKTPNSQYILTHTSKKEKELRKSNITTFGDSAQTRVYLDRTPLSFYRIILK